MDTTEQSIISIATGFLGLERGLERAGLKIQVAAYVEIEAFIIANLVAAMETNNLATAPIWSDVKTFPYRNFYKKIHGITAGYPCQPFSNAGQRKGTRDPRHLWPFIYRIVQTVKPFWCFFENVEGHLNLGFDEVSRDLRKMGYRVEAGIFSAEEVGATHQRKRLFILAVMGNTTIKRQQIAGPSSIRQLQEKKGEGFHNRFKQPSDELGYSKGADKQRNFEQSGGSQKQIRGHGDKVANTNNTRFREYGRSITTQEKHTTIKYNRWPAKPGQPQHPWEAPRTIKPGVGVTVDGYNFRTDLLRAAGNGVVEQTAEKAFITLLGKFK